MTALAGFVKTRWREPEPELSSNAAVVVFYEVGYALRTLGYPLAEAAEAVETSLRFALEGPDWNIAAMRAAELSQILLVQGDVIRAFAVIQDAMNFAKKIDDKRKQTKEFSLRLPQLADVLHQMGRKDEAKAAFGQAEKLQQEWLPDEMSRKHLQPIDILVKYRGYRYCDLLLDYGRFDEVITR